MIEKYIKLMSYTIFKPFLVVVKLIKHDVGKLLLYTVLGFLQLCQKTHKGVVDGWKQAKISVFNHDGEVFPDWFQILIVVGVPPLTPIPYIASKEGWPDEIGFLISAYAFSVLGWVVILFFLMVIITEVERNT